MTERDYTRVAAGSEATLDEFLRDSLPEVKLALGDLIDRENARSLPGRYARLLPESLLVVTLREDVAEALAPIAVPVERELTDSCTRHGSLYDRAYRVQLRRTDDPDAPLFSVASHAGHAAPEPMDDGGGTGQSGMAPSAPPGQSTASAVDAGQGPTAPVAPLPLTDPDATRISDAGPPGWQPGRWLLLVEDEGGEQREVFRITDPFTTIGRRTDDPELRTTFALSDVPNMSRRQLALIWQERDGAPGFQVLNVGLNPVHLPGQDIPGARVGRGVLDPDSLAAEHQGWLPPGVPLRIGSTGPILRIEEVPEDEPEDAELVPDDPEATRYE